MKLSVGSRYGSIGVEICDETGCVAVAGRVAENQRRSLREIAARPDPTPRQKADLLRLEASADTVLEFAHELVRRWNAGEGAPDELAPKNAGAAA